MTNISDESCRENLNIHFMFNKFSKTGCDAGYCNFIHDVYQTVSARPGFDCDL